jgi:hypothetical protein
VQLVHKFVCSQEFSDLGFILVDCGPQAARPGAVGPEPVYKNVMIFQSSMNYTSPLLKTSMN